MANIQGTSGNDTLTGGLGPDVFDGGLGDDLFVSTVADLDGDTINFFEPGDRLRIIDAPSNGAIIEITGGKFAYAGAIVTLAGWNEGVVVASPFVGGGTSLAYYAPVIHADPGSYTNSSLTYAGITLNAPSSTLINTSSGRILHRGVTLTQGGSTFTNALGGQVASVTGSSGDDTVINRGLIFDSVELDGGNDAFTTDQGNPVDLGAGDDTLRVEGGAISINADGGPGTDEVIIAPYAQFWANGLQNFERAIIEAPSNSPNLNLGIVGLSNLRSITIPKSIGYSTTYFADSYNPLVDLSADNRNVGMSNSMFRSIVGGMNSDYVELGNNSIIGAVLLHGGNDELRFSAFDGPLATVSESIDGGDGFDTVAFNSFRDGRSFTVDLNNFSGFEQLLFNAFYVYTGISWSVEHIKPTAVDIRVGEKTGLTIASSILPAANVSGVHGSHIVIAADSVVASISDANGTLFDTPLDVPQGNANYSSTIEIYGQVLADIVMAQGDDVVAAQAGRVDGTVYGNGGNDTLQGGAGNDRIAGGFGADSLSGNAGNDTLWGGIDADSLSGGAGDDLIDGGPGVDLAHYGVARTDATVSRDPTTRTLTVTLPGEGTDTVSRVEQFQFADGLYSFNFARAANTLANFGAQQGWTDQSVLTRHLADVNGDGRLDIVGIGYSAVRVALGNGDGTFQAAKVAVANYGVAQDWVNEDVYPRVLADVNGDGRADLLGFGYAGVKVALGQADGTFAAATLGAANFGGAQGWSSAAAFPRLLADVNGDGKLDILGFGYSAVRVALGNGDGTFQAAKVGVANFGQGLGWSDDDAFHRELADVNGDGRLDIVGFGHSGVRVALGSGDGTFAPATLAIANFGAAQEWKSQADTPRLLADVNGDGRADIVGFGHSGVRIALANADGSFAAAQLAVNAFGQLDGWASQDATPRMLADLNHDGALDVIGFGPQGTSVAYGHGDGTFTAASSDLANFGITQGWTSDRLYHRELGDIDGDGLPDIVGFGNGGAIVAMNQGDVLV